MSGSLMVAIEPVHARRRCFFPSCAYVEARKWGIVVGGRVVDGREGKVEVVVVIVLRSARCEEVVVVVEALGFGMLGIKTDWWLCILKMGGGLVGLVMVGLAVKPICPADKSTCGLEPTDP